MTLPSSTVSASWVKAQALALGFDLVGITRAEALQEEGLRLESWLAQGYNAGMDWMNRYREARKDPRELLPGCKSVVCVALNYYTEDALEVGDVKIARYARGKDYHKLIRKRLGKLLTLIQEQVPGVEGRPFSDSAPLLERALAVRAGLGWVGKNGNLITKNTASKRSPSIGSWVFLGELLLTLELEPDEPKTLNHCGSCTRCIDICPTEAIVAPAVIDANRCLPFWTIEDRGETLPEGISANLQSWAFGCDLCQEVCPWNVKFQTPTAEAAFSPNPLLNPAQSSILLGLSEEEFAQTFAGTPLRRPGYQRFSRNVKAAALSGEQAGET